ncbi:hypothetical protein GS493_04125 [Rhodococcus hoagii]|nr:hypothetical protein [Prescottella equi]NKZ71930.1 hypothetical protein [Prescottella equi]
MFPFVIGIPRLGFVGGDRGVRRPCIRFVELGATVRLLAAAVAVTVEETGVAVSDLRVEAIVDLSDELRGASSV